MKTKDNEKEKNQTESNIIDPFKTFNFITSKYGNRKHQGRKALFTLGIYCLQNNEANVAQRAFKRLLMREKDKC